MKKILISILLLAGSVSLFAQEQTASLPGKTENLFIGYNAGVGNVINNGMNTATFNCAVSFGQQINPIWAWRASIGGFWRTLDVQKPGFTSTWKPYAETDFDAIINFRNLFGDKYGDYKFNIYAFGGPQVTYSSAVSLDVDNSYGWQVTPIDNIGGVSIQVVEDNVSRHYVSRGLRARIGVTAGIGFSYRVSDLISLNLESRYSAGPSIFGWGSDNVITEYNLFSSFGIKFHL